MAGRGKRRFAVTLSLHASGAVLIAFFVAKPFLLAMRKSGR